MMQPGMFTARHQHLRLEATRIPGLRLVAGFPKPGRSAVDPARPETGAEQSRPEGAPRPIKHLAQGKQDRLTALMDGANEGTLTGSEREELHQLVDEVEELALENARHLFVPRRDP